MKLSQLFIISALRIALAIVIFPTLPKLMYNSLEIGIDQYNTAEVFSIIFTSGIVSIILFEMIFVGRRGKYEKIFIGFALLFFVFVFYKSAMIFPILAAIYCIAGLVLLLLRIPYRIYLEKKQKGDGVV